MAWGGMPGLWAPLRGGGGGRGPAQPRRRWRICGGNHLPARPLLREGPFGLSDEGERGYYFGESIVCPEATMLSTEGIVISRALARGTSARNNCHPSWGLGHTRAHRVWPARPAVSMFLSMCLVAGSFAARKAFVCLWCLCGAAFFWRVLRLILTKIEPCPKELVVLRA